MNNKLKMAEVSQRPLQSIIDEVLSTCSSFDLTAFNYPLQDEWALPAQTMQFAARIADMMKPARIIEFGSGYSTLVLAKVSRQTNGRLLSFEHSEFFAQRTEAQLGSDAQAGAATILHRPLKIHRYGAKLLSCYSICWKEHKDFEGCELSLVDGPPSSISREAVLYELFPRLRVGGVVLVDDMNRESEQRWLKTWKQVFGEALETCVLSSFGRGLGVFRKSRNADPVFSFRLGEIWNSWYQSARVAWTSAPSLPE